MGTTGRWAAATSAATLAAAIITAGAGAAPAATRDASPYEPLSGRERSIGPGSQVGIGDTYATFRFERERGAVRTRVVGPDGRVAATLDDVGRPGIGGRLGWVVAQDASVVVVGLDDGGEDSCVEVVALGDPGGGEPSVDDLGFTCAAYAPGARVVLGDGRARLLGGASSPGRR